MAARRAAEPNHRRGRDRHLRRLCRDEREEWKSASWTVADVPQRADDGQLGWRHVHGRRSAELAAMLPVTAMLLSLLEEAEAVSGAAGTLRSVML